MALDRPTHGMWPGAWCLELLLLILLKKASFFSSFKESGHLLPLHALQGLGFMELC